MRRARHSGFSLIELVIVILIVGILAGVAVGNYRQFVGMARRLDARSALAGISVAQTGERLVTGAWACTFDGLPAVLDGMTRVSSTEMRRGVYTFQLACDDGGYRATATGDIDGDTWLDVAVATPNTRFAMQYDDVRDSYDGSAGLATPTPAPTATPAPSATPPPAATPAPSPPSPPRRRR